MRKKKDFILTLLFEIFLVMLVVKQLTGRELFLPRWSLEDLGNSVLNKSNTGAPVDNVRIAAEYEPSQGIIISWYSYDWYNPSVYKEVLSSLDEGARAIIIVENETEEQRIRAEIAEEDIYDGFLEFMYIPTNSSWIRDYSPIFVYNDSDSLAGIDLQYYPERILDNDVSRLFCINEGLDRYDLNIYLEGGNIMTDGKGLVMISDMVFDKNPSLSFTELDSLMQIYFGANRTVIMEKLPDDETGHIDMFAKIVDNYTIMLSYPVDSTRPECEIMDRNFALVDSLSISGEEDDFDIIELPMPIQYRMWPPGWTYQTYTNSLILNHQVFVPTYRNDFDSTAIRIYQETFPDYEIISIDCYAVIQTGGAVHCLVMQYPEFEPLFVYEQPEHPKKDIVCSISPNPFNEIVSISISDFDSNEKCYGNIYNLLGNKVKSFKNELYPGQILTWNGISDSGRSMPSGVYLFVIDSDYRHEAQKIIYSK